MKNIWRRRLLAIWRVYIRIPISQGPRIYIAGPMRGYEHYNFPAFDAATRKFESWGWVVYNPAEMDRAVGMFEWMPIVAGFFRSAMRRDLKAITKCQAIALLPGWEKSSGVKVEKTLSDFLGLDCFDAVTMRKITQ